MIPYDELPLDKERHHPLHFIRSEVAARAGAITTGVSTGVVFIDKVEPWVRFSVGVIGVFIGLATLIYYVLGIVKRWRELRDEE